MGFKYAGKFALAASLLYSMEIQGDVHKESNDKECSQICKILNARDESKKYYN